MILEAIVTTVDAEGVVNIAPLGPHVDRQLTRFELRPFVGSRTHANLRESGRATIHVTDDCLLLARSAIGWVDPAGLVRSVDDGDHWVLRDACRWFAVRVEKWHDHPQRPRARCIIVAHNRQRDFFGFNRAQYAVVEAAILATRVHLIAAEVLRTQLRQLATLVERTGGDREHEAFQLLEEYIANAPGKLES